MGIQRNNGYSAHVEGFFVVSDTARTRLAKTNEVEFTPAEPCEFAPGTIGELQVSVDGDVHSRLVVLPDGAAVGQATVRYEMAAPF
jgi:hypothetical protein